MQSPSGGRNHNTVGGMFYERLLQRASGLGDRL